jgi:hypothetical protein
LTIVRLLYTPPGKHELRPIPVAYSLRSLQGRIAERDQDDPRWDFLANIFNPHIEEKRWQLQYWRAEDVAALDRETEAEAAQYGPSSGRQAAPRAPASGRRRRGLLLRSVPGRSTGLRWVPKVAIQCIQGTSVPEAQEVDAEHDFKFGPKDVLNPEDCERLKEECALFLGTVVEVVRLKLLTQSFPSAGLFLFLAPVTVCLTLAL